MSIVETLSASRRAAIADLCVGTYAGTDELVAAIVADSRHVHAWRPARAGALLVVAETVNTDERVWMHPEEFKTWRATARIISKQRAKVEGVAVVAPEDDLGITKAHAADLQRADRTKLRGLKISKSLAMACAHYNLGLGKPVQNGDSDHLRAWFEPRFGGTERVAQFLDMHPEFLITRLRGSRAPEGFLIRALDYLWTMGPICPFGDRPTVPIWPGQDVPR